MSVLVKGRSCVTDCYDCITDDEDEGSFGLCEDVHCGPCHLEKVPRVRGKKGWRAVQLLRAVTMCTFSLAEKGGAMCWVLLLVVSR